MLWSGATDRGEQAQVVAGRGRATPAPRTRTVVLLAATAAAIAWACARPSSPPGAAEETEPPGIRSLFPVRDTVLGELGRAAKIRFDEPIQGGAGLGRQLLASPAYRYSVSVGHSEISIRPEGGWRPGAVYVLELPSGISDLLGNAREDPIRMVFSTGPPIRPTRVRAQVFDRITGQRQQGARMLLLAAREDTVVTAADTVPYTAVADSVGIYSRRHVPPGTYWAYGFVDQNRNLRLDRRLEPYDSVRIELDSDSAEAEVNFFTLQPDSTPPRLGRIRTPDSVTIRLEFDEYLRPGHLPGGFLVYPAGGGEELPVDEIRVLTAEDTVKAEEPATDTAAADSIRPDSLAADTLPPDSLPPDTTAVDTAASDTAADTAVADTTAGDSPRPDSLAADSLAADTAAADTMEVEKPPRPTRLLEIRFDRPLDSDTFRVQLQDVQNMWGLGADVDTTFAYVPPSDTAAPDAAAADTAAADTAATDTVAPDTIGPDTAGVEAVAPDTAVADSLARDSVANDSVSADTAARDTNPPPDVVPRDSVAADTSGAHEP